MFIYIILLMTALSFLKFSKKSDKILPFIFLFILIFVGAFRYDVGQDYMSYTDIFNGYKSGRSGIGFETLCSMCKKIGGTSQLLFFLMSVSTLSFFYVAMRKYSTNLMLCLFIFFCFGQMYLNTFNTVRQCFAASVFMLSIQYIYKKKLWYYIGLILIAASFHLSSLILMPLYWFLNRDFSLFFVAAVSCIVILIPSFDLFILIAQIDEYKLYQNSEEVEISFTDYIYLIMALSIFVFRKKLFVNNPYRYIFQNINIIFGLLTLSFILSGTSSGVLLLNRLRYYFIFFYAIMIQIIISDVKNKLTREMVMNSVALVLSVLFVRTTILLGENYNLLPYEFNFKLF